MPPSPLARVRKIVGELPETHEVEAWGSATFRVKNKIFAMYAEADNHHGEGRPGLWLKATAENQQIMLQFAPKRFYYPAYVGKSGWIGIFLDKVCDWDELVELIRDAWTMTAPKKLVAALNQPPTAPQPAPARRAVARKSAKKTATKATTKKKPHR